MIILPKLFYFYLLSVKLKAALYPYLQVTQAVKSGDVARFDKVIKDFSVQFNADHTNTLITRLHHNVIKTAVKTISLAYRDFVPNKADKNQVKCGTL